MSYSENLKDQQPVSAGTTVACCVPELTGSNGQKSEAVSCGCETTAPAAGEGACCGRQAARFGIEVRAGGGCGCS